MLHCYRLTLDTAMKQANLVQLRDLIANIARESSLGERVRDVVVEAEGDSPGTEFLRVILEMNNLDGLRFDDIKPLLTTIEDAVARVDERFPSVRFAEAA